MTPREYLIAYAIKYNGSYERIKLAISKREEIEPVKCDNCITIFDNDYPKLLLELKEPPFVLFYKGNLDLLKEKSVGVVGCRKPCEYSSKATQYFVEHTDKVVISGLSLGISTIAHKHAKKTIAILGCGIDYIYPINNEKLYSRVEKEGLLLSEYPLNTPPLPYNFPFRDRIIAALSDELWVMEAHEKSGNHRTIQNTMQLNKEIFVLPFDVFKEEGKYNNYLIDAGASLLKIEEE